jgi:hypothetical protein
MERINQLEKKDQQDINSNSILKKIGSESMSFDNVKIPNDDSRNNKTMLSKLRYTEYGKDTNRSINIAELIEENERLKEIFSHLQNIKNQLRLSRKENNYISDQITEMNTEYFKLSKIFTEGIHELSKELLKIHEIQLDKIVAST